MANSKGSSMYSGKHALLPPKIPFPSVSQAYSDYNPMMGLNVAHKNLRRTSSESFANVEEEQPSWLEDLLNEPEMPVRRGGHRRSSSDSSAYLDPANLYNISNTDKNLTSIPSWASQDIDHGKVACHIPMYAEMNSGKQRNRGWESSVNAVTHPGGVSPGRDNVALQSSGSCAPQEADGLASTVNKKHDSVEPGGNDPKASCGRKDGSHAKPFASESDTKRAKQYVLIFSVF